MNQYLKNTLSGLLIFLFAVISRVSYAQTPDTWMRKHDFGDTISNNGNVGVERNGAVSFSIGNKGYIGTGLKGTNTRLNDFWEYDPETDAWTQKANFGGLARAFASGFSIGDKGYVGCGDANSSAHTSADFWEYDAASNVWTRKADFGGVPRRGAVGFAIASKGYMGTGRYQGPDHYKDIWEYDPATDVWTRKADLTGNSRAFAAVFSIGNKGYLGTGRDDNGFVKDFWEFDPEVNIWTQKTDFVGDKRYGAIGISIGAYGYIGTGATASSGLSNDFWEYNPYSDSWIRKADFGGAPRFLTSGFSIGNKAYIGTGQINTDTYVNSYDFWEFTPAAIWTGATNSIWDLATNWQSGVIPEGTTNVTIPSATNYPVIGSNAVSKDLTINSGTVLTIASGKSLTVNGSLINSSGISGLVIKSDASGTGSLIHNTTGVNATVERYIAAANWTSSGEGWHLLSSPIASPYQAISGSWTPSGVGNDYDFYALSESENTNNWLDQKISANNITNFIPGFGYLVAYQQTGTNPRTFTGSLTNEDVTLTNLSKTATSKYSGFHLVGNPFSSAVDWNSGSWTKSNIDANAYVWGNGGYKSTVDPSVLGIIPSMNGFMIRVNSSTGTLIIPSNSRTHNAANWSKSTGNEMIVIKANDISEGISQSSIVRFDLRATNDFDTDFDSYFISGNAPMFYSVSSGNNLMLNTLPDIASNPIIPFTFDKNSSQNFSIELEQGITDVVITLEDLKTSISHNLTLNPVYKFTSSAGDDPARFKLHLQSFVSIPESKSEETFSLMYSNGTISLKTFRSVDAEIKVTNMLGQVVLRGKTSGNHLTTLNASTLQNGVYVISLSGNNKVASKKIVVSK